MSEAGSFAELLAELRGRGLDAGAYASLIELFRAYDGARLRISAQELARHERRIMARRLLAERASRVQVRDRIMSAFGVAKRTAHRDVQAALSERCGPPIAPRLAR